MAEELYFLDVRGPKGRIISSVKAPGPMKHVCFRANEAIALVARESSLHEAELLLLSESGAAPEHARLETGSRYRHEVLGAVAFTERCERLALIDANRRLELGRVVTGPLRVDRTPIALLPSRRGAPWGGLLFSPSGRRLLVGYLGSAFLFETPAELTAVDGQESVHWLPLRYEPDLPEDPAEIGTLAFSDDESLAAVQVTMPGSKSRVSVGIGDMVLSHQMSSLVVWKLPAEATYARSETALPPLLTWHGLLGARDVAVSLDKYQVLVTLGRAFRRETWTLPLGDPKAIGTAFTEAKFFPSSGPSDFRTPSSNRATRLSKDGALAADGAGNALWVWDRRHGTERARLEQLDGASAWDASIDSGWLATATEPVFDPGTVRLWRVQPMHPYVETGFQSNGVADIQFSSESTSLAAVGDFSESGYAVRVWDLVPSADGAIIDARRVHDLWGYQAVAFKSDGGLIVGRGIRLQVSPIELPPEEVKEEYTITTLAPGARYARLRGWADGEELDVGVARVKGTEFGTPHPVSEVWFSGDGRLALASQSGGAHELYDVDDDEEAPASIELVPPPACEPERASAALSASPRVLTIACGRKVQVWSLGARRGGVVRGTGSSAFEIDGAATAIDVTNDGRLLAVGTSDATLFLWDLRRGTMRVRMAVPGGTERVRFSPDARLLATGHADGTIALWPVSIADLREDACRRVVYNLTREEWASFLSGVDYRPTCASVEVPDMAALRKKYGDD
jgi:WD40 repeat protein